METKKTTRSFVTRLFCFRLFSSRSKEEVETSKKEEAKSENSEKEESEDDKNRFFEECRLEWKSTIEDLRIAKNQQWLTIYYGFLLQFALIYIFIGKLGTMTNRYILLMVLFVVFIAVLWISHIFQKNIREYRELIIDIEKNLTRSF